MASELASPHRLPPQPLPATAEEAAAAARRTTSSSSVFVKGDVESELIVDMHHLPLLSVPSHPDNPGNLSLSIESPPPREHATDESAPTFRTKK